MASRNMLAIPIPLSPNLASPFAQALRQSISSHAADTHHPDAFASDIAQLAQLRASVGSMEEHSASLEYAYKYHAQLTFASTKLPSPLPLAFPWSQPLVSTSFFASGASSGAAAASFDYSSDPSSSDSKGMWSRNDSFGLVYDNQAYVGHPILAWERANVLFAIAALLSSLAAQEPRNEGTSIKRAVGFFQASSATLAHLSSVIEPALLSKLPVTSPPHGLSAARLRPLATLALAQAQECFWQKAVSDGMKPITVAKLAKAVESLYEQAAEEAKQAEIENGVEAFPRTWLNHIIVKQYHFAAASQYRKSQEDLSNSRYGDEIARLQLAETHVKTALGTSKKALPNSSEALMSDLKGLQGVVEINLKRARKDNELIYLEPVTTAGSLPTIAGARTVQAKLPVEIARPFDCLRAPSSTPPAAQSGFEDILPALGKPLLGALVPYGAHVAVSVYEDRKDRWWRDNVEGKRQELEAVVRSTLDSLDLPGALDDLDRPQIIIQPQLLSKAQEVVSGGGIGELERLCSEVKRIADLNHSLLTDSRSLLESESTEDTSLREQFVESKHWTRQDSSIAGQTYWARLSELENTLKMAGESDTVVRSKIERWASLWRVLEGGEETILGSLPQGVEIGDSDQDGTGRPVTGSSAVVRELRGHLESLDDVLFELASLASETRSLVWSDDIRDKVMREVARLSESQEVSCDYVDLGPEMFESLFEVEFKKYHIIDREIESLEGKAASLLDGVRASNDALRAQMSTASPAKAKLSAHFSELQAAASKWFEVKANLTEGFKFYNSLASIIQGFQQSCREWNRARSIDVQRLVEQFSGTSLELRKGPWESSSATGAASSPAVAATMATTTHRRSARHSAKPMPVTRASRRGKPNGAVDVRNDGDVEEDEVAVQALAGGLTTQLGAQAPSVPPQWGAWGGGQIRFGDD